MKVWLLTDGEPLFFEEGKSCHRHGSLAKELANQDNETIWWTSRMDHNSKSYNESYEDKYTLSPKLRVNFLKSAGYKKNMSLARIFHARSIASEFLKLSEEEEKPDIIVASMPSPEFCLAGAVYAKKKNIPFVIDIRDPWPDIFVGYFPSFLRIFLFPLMYFYRRMIKRITRSASGIVAVSRSQLDWGIGYSGRRYNSDRDKLIYIGYVNEFGPKQKEQLTEFSEDNPLRCMYITSWGSSYDSLTLVETARILQDKVGKKIHITATGNGEGRDESIAKAIGLNNITFTGFISSEEINSLMSESHVGLILMKGGITKYWIGNKIGEYIASSFGIVNNVETEVAQLIEKKEIGINIPPQDPIAAANAIIDYSNNPAKLENHMNNSKELYIKSFDRQQNSREYIDYLQKLINTHKY